MSKETDDKEEESRNKLKVEFYLSEFGFTCVVE